MDKPEISRRTAVALLMASLLPWPIRLGPLARDAGKLHSAQLGLILRNIGLPLVAQRTISMKDLLSSSHGPRSSSLVSLESSSDMVIARSRADFAEGRFATVQGWVISQTDVDLLFLVVDNSPIGD